MMKTMLKDLFRHSPRFRAFVIAGSTVAIVWTVTVLWVFLFGIPGLTPILNR